MNSLKILKVKDPKGKINPLDEKLHPHLPRHPFTKFYVSSPRSGKTSCILNELMNPAFYNALEYWTTVYYCSPTQLFDKTLAHALPKLENLIQIDDHHDLMRIDILLESIMKSQMKLLSEDDPVTGKKKEMERICIIFDDCLGYLQSNESLSYFITKFRHFSCSVYITSQSFRKIPKVIRNCVGNVCFHKLANEKELEAIFEEYGCCFHPDFKNMAKKITNTKYNFCYLDNENLKMYQNYDTLVLDAADENVN